MLQHGWTWKRSAKWKKPDTKGHILWFHFYEMSRIGKSVETACILMAARVWGRRGNGEKLLNECKVLFWSDGNVLELDRGCDCTTCECPKCHWIVHLK